MAQAAKNKVETAPTMVSTVDETVSQNEEREAKLKLLISVTCFHNDNLDETKSNKFEIHITHKDNVILQNAIDITENSKMVLHGELEVNYFNISELSDLIENPILVLVLETVSTLKGKKGGAKSASSKVTDKPGLSPLGYCNLDLFSLLNGTEVTEETMILQPLVTPTTVEMTTWPNLPTIVMRAEIEKSENCEEEFLESLNMLTITMENLVNAPSRVTVEYDCTIFSVVPKQNEVIQEMSFSKGVAGINANVETMKKWGALWDLEGRGNISPYPLSTQNPTNPQRMQINVFSEEEVPLIEWNTFHRCFIDTNDTEILKQYIIKNHCWPLEIYLMPKASNTGKAKKKNVVDDVPLHLMAFPDVGRLLYPGETSARVATTVYEYSEEYMLWRGGMKSFILEPVENVVPVVLAKPTTVPSLENASSSTLADPQCEEAFDEEGRPIYLIMEIQLLNPLTKCKTIDEIYDDIHKLLPVREIDIVLEKAQSAKKKYHQCVKDSTTILNEEYAKFLKNSKLFPCKVAGDDEMSAFIRFLNSSGVYANLVGGLCESVSHMVDDNCKLGESIDSEDDYQCFISKAFIELVNEMHKALMFPKSKVFIPIIESKDLLYFAREEEALKHNKEAENLHLQRISLKKDAPQVWFDYAVFCLRKGSHEESYVAICEVIQLDFHHQMGLLLCGALLMYKEQNSEAENFMLALMNLYPKFFEGYIASSLFYKKIGRHEAADVTMEIAKNIIAGCALCSCSNVLCCCDRDEFMLQEEFLWYDKTIPKNKIFLRTCALFIRLGLFEFAETILAEQLIEEGPSLLYDYLMATVHFFNGKYCEALKHLQQEMYESVATFLLSSMEGHCLLALENMEAADEAFRYTNLCFDRPNDIHLVYIRLGQFQLNTGNYEHAKKMFVNCCNYSPTPNSWLGAGIAFLKMEKFDDCEKCLIEANFLNRHNALVWAYLAILNIHLKKLTEFKKCFMMAIKNGLSDEKLLLEIKELTDESMPEESCSLLFNTFVL